MAINQSSLFFRKKIKSKNNSQTSFGCQHPDKGLKYFYELNRNAVITQEEIGHGLVELEGYLNELRFQQDELKARLQLGESCQRLMNEKIMTSKDSVSVF